MDLKVLPALPRYLGRFSGAFSVYFKRASPLRAMRMRSSSSTRHHTDWIARVMDSSSAGWAFTYSFSSFRSTMLALAMEEDTDMLSTSLPSSPTTMPVVRSATQRVMNSSTLSDSHSANSGWLSATLMGCTMSSWVSGMIFLAAPSPSTLKGPTHTWAWASRCWPVTLSVSPTIRRSYLPTISPSWALVRPSSSFSASVSDSTERVSVYSTLMESRSSSQPDHWDWRRL